MEINSLQLFCQSASDQRIFYGERLGLTGEMIGDKEFKISLQENELSFKESTKPFYYHFAFLIPTGTLESAIEFLENRNIEILLFNGKKIVDFGTGRATYFYDPEGNILEFIERPSLDYPKKNQFQIEDIIKVNEIGLPCKATLKMSKRLMEDYGVIPIEKNLLSSEFRWIGDFNGVFIVTKIGRPWKPTQKPGIVNDFNIQFSTPKGEYDIRFRNNEIIQNKTTK